MRMGLKAFAIVVCQGIWSQQVLETTGRVVPKNIWRERRLPHTWMVDFWSPMRQDVKTGGIMGTWMERSLIQVPA